MPLKIELKPNESIIIGEALITNADARIRFYIEGDVPILREKFILRQKDANTPSKRIYFVVQQMYLSNSANQELENLYLEYVKDLQEAAPSLGEFLNQINTSVAEKRYYDALKIAEKLVKQEKASFGAFLG